MKERIVKLETAAAEMERQRWAEELASDLGVRPEELLLDLQRIDAKLQQWKMTHPQPVLDGKIDVEPYIRIIAEEYGLDPDDFVEEMRRVVDERTATLLNESTASTP